MNLFARSLHLPMALDAALEALAAGQVIAVDIATANGRPFVHQFSVGIHPKLVKLRESLTYKSRLGKMLASTRAALGVALRPPNFTTEVLTRDGLTRRRTAGITVSNNPFDEGHLPLADRLDRGVLGIYLIAPLNALGLAKLCVSMALGKFRSLPEIADREAREVTLRFPHRKTGAVAVIDGELVNLPGRVELRVHPGELRVVVPGAEAATGASVDVPALASA
jgi:diacylglycerol kinase family enzyme